MDTRDRIRTHIYRKSRPSASGLDPEAVHANTGIHFNALVRESAFAPGQVQYHLHRLVDTGEIVRSEFYGQTHYYPPEYDEQAQAVLALLRRGTAREIVVHVVAHEPTTPLAVANALEIARSTLEYHLVRLTEHGVVEKTSDERSRVQLRVANPERMAALLSVVEPTTAGQLVDGLSCLVDQLFEPPGEGDSAAPD